MVWVIFAVVGVSLWFCALAMLVLVRRNRALGRRPGNVPVRVRLPGTGRWVRGHALWVHDVFAFRGGRAVWKEELVWVAGVSLRAPLPAERAGWRRLGDDPIVAVLMPAEAADAPVEVAARGEDVDLLCGAFMRLDNQVGSGMEHES